MPKYLGIGPVKDSKVDPTPLLLAAAGAWCIDGIVTDDIIVADLVRKNFSANFKVIGKPGEQNKNTVLKLPAASVISTSILRKAILEGGTLKEVAPTAFSLYEWYKYRMHLTQSGADLKYINFDITTKPKKNLIYLTRPFYDKSLSLAVDPDSSKLFAVGSSLNNQITSEEIGDISYFINNSYGRNILDEDTFRAYSVVQITHYATKALQAIKCGDKKSFCTYLDICWGNERAELLRLNKEMSPGTDLFYASLRSDIPGCGGRSVQEGFIWVKP